MIILSISLWLMLNCSKESTPIYWDKGMVEISLIQTGRIDFFVPDQGDSGWNYYDDPGEDTVTLDFAVKNLTDKELSLSGIYWRLFAGNEWVWSEYNENVPPVIFPANDSTTIQVSIIVSEYIAYWVDHSDGFDDFSGTGTFKFWMTGYDNERYDDIGSNYLYAEMSVAKP